MTAEPTEPPTSGPAKEQPPINGEWHPQVTIYNQLHGPTLWIYLATGWTLATVTSKHVYPGNVTIVHVEMTITENNGTQDRVIRAFPWGKDNLRPA